MRNLIAVLIGILISFVLMTPWVYAETIPATQGTTVVNSSPYYYTSSACVTSSYTSHNTFSEVGNAVAARCGPYYGDGSYTFNSANSTQPAGSGTISLWLDRSTGGSRGASGTKISGCLAPAQNVGGQCVTYTYTCPANQGWTLEGQSCTRPECPYDRNPDGTCKGQCDGKGGTSAASGIYEETPPQLICKSGCAATRSLDLGDVNRYSKLVNGVVKYYGAYAYTYADMGGATGVVCSSVSAGLASSTPPDPVNLTNITETCAAGQGMASMGGKTVCVDQSTGQPVASSGTTQKDVKTTTNTVTNPDGSTTTTKTTTYPDGSKTIESTTTAAGGGSSSSSTQQIDSEGKPVLVTGPSGTGSGSTGGGTSGGGTGGLNQDGVKNGVKDGIKAHCQENPNSPMCKEIEPGTAASIEGLYEKQSGEKTFESVLVGFKNNVSGLPFFTAATSAFSLSIPAGSCSGLSASIPIDILDFHTVWNIDLTETFCGTTALYVYFIFGIGLLITATWVGIRIALL